MTHFDHRGFTLVEIIISLTLLAILGGVVLPYFIGGVTRGTKPLEMVRAGMDLNSVMERIATDYRRLLADGDMPVLATLQTHVQNGNVDTSTPYYGSYTPAMKYIDFDDTTQTEEATPGTPPACKVLKVTITHNSQSLTALFTE